MTGRYTLWVVMMCVGCFGLRDKSEKTDQTESNQEQVPEQEQDVQQVDNSNARAVWNEGIQSQGDNLRIEMKPRSAQLCKGECVEISVEATGAISPYTYSWNHGIPPTNGPHLVCPEVSTTYTVTVQDNGLDTQEFQSPIEEVQGSIVISVRDNCSATENHGRSDAGFCVDGECDAIDGCALDNGGCDPLVTCTETEGTRICGPCPLGYEGDGYTGCTPPLIQPIETPDDETSYAIATDNSGGVYVTGYTNGDLDGNINAGDYDIFLIKYDTHGINQWTRLLGTSDYDVGNDVATDSSDNIYVAGTTRGDLDGNINAGDYDAFVVKYDSDGVKQWTRQIGSSSSEYSEGVATDNDGNVYIVGYIWEGSLDEDYSATNLNGDIFVVKYDTEGVEQWIRQMGSSEGDHGVDVTTDGSGNVYVTGTTQGSVDGNTYMGGTDIIIVKYDSDGVKQWTRQLGTEGEDYSYGGIVTDGVGDVYVAGDVDVDPEGATDYDVFVVKYDSEGVEQWTQQAGTSSYDSSTGIAIDDNGNVYVTGETDGSLFANNDGTSNSDFFVVKYDSEGVLLWSSQPATSQSDYTSGVATDGSGNVYVSGVVFNGLNEAGTSCLCDLFIARYSSDGVFIALPEVQEE